MRDLCAVHEVRRTENVGPGVPNSLCDNCSVILTRVRFPDGARIFQVEKISQYLGLATNVNLVHGELRACDSSRSRGVSDGSPVDPLTAVFVFTRVTSV